MREYALVHQFRGILRIICRGGYGVSYGNVELPAGRKRELRFHFFTSVDIFSLFKSLAKGHIAQIVEYRGEETLWCGDELNRTLGKKTKSLRMELNAHFKVRTCIDTLARPVYERLIFAMPFSIISNAFDELYVVVLAIKCKTPNSTRHTSTNLKV